MMRFFWIILNLPESFTTNLNPWKKCDQFDLMELIATNPNRKIILFATNLNLSESVATILNPCKNVRPIWTHNYICDQIRTVKWYFCDQIEPHLIICDQSGPMEKIATNSTLQSIYLRPIQTYLTFCDHFDHVHRLLTTNPTSQKKLRPIRAYTEYF